MAVSRWREWHTVTNIFEMIHNYAIVSGKGVERPELNIKKDMNTSLYSIFVFALYMSAGLSKYRTYEIKHNVAVNSLNAAIFYEPVRHWNRIMWNCVAITAHADAPGALYMYGRPSTTAVIS